MGEKRKVLVVDDHPIVREGIVRLVAGQADLEICGSAADIASALRCRRTLTPDIALVDLSLGAESGLDLVPLLAEADPPVPVLVLSMHDEALYAKRALQAGASGYIMKHEYTDRLLHAIRTVIAGEVYVSPRVNATLLRSVRVGGDPVVGEGPLAELTNRELQIYRLIGHGLGTKAIAGQLCLSIKTVESHRARIKTKLGLTTSTELIAHAAEWSFRAGKIFNMDDEGARSS